MGFFIDVLMKIDEIEKPGNLFIPHKWKPENHEQKAKEFEAGNHQNRRRARTGVVRVGCECLREIGLPIMMLPPNLLEPEYQLAVFEEIERCKADQWRGSIPIINPFELPLTNVAKPEQVTEAKEQ